MSNAFRNRGHECLTVDWDEKFPSDLHMDINDLTTEMVLERLGQPDVIFCGSDCKSYSLAAVSHHRRKNETTGYLEPVSNYAKFCDKTNFYVRELAEKLNPKILIFENPRACFHKMPFVKDLIINTTTYCQYGFTYMKPTVFPSNIDLKLKPPCKNGDPCHQAAPRGSRTGVQGIKGADNRAVYPPALCEHIVKRCEEYLEEICNG